MTSVNWIGGLVIFPSDVHIASPYQYDLDYPSSFSHGLITVRKTIYLYALPKMGKILSSHWEY